MERSRLFEVLQEFRYADGDKAFLKEEFDRIAKAAFYSGCFLFNGGRPDEFRIEIICIEFYYHELEDCIKDAKKLIRDFRQDVFPVGSLLPHEFGVDVNFDDNVSEKFRASFLIRGYRRIENGQVAYENNKRSKTWNPRDLWYDLLGSASCLEGGCSQIEWIDNGLPYDDVVLPEPQTRIIKKPVDGFHPKWRYVK